MRAPGIDQVKVWATYGIAFFVVIAGFYFLFATRNDPNATKDTVALVAGFVGSTLTFLYSQVVQSQTAHQTSVAANTLTGNGTVSVPPPATVTINTSADETKPAEDGG